MSKHEIFMEHALRQARKALVAGDFPVGCVLEYQNEVVATGRRCNSFDKINEMDHAEMVALRTLLNSDRQIDFRQVTLYSTMEPCLMCYSTLLVNGIQKIVYSYEDAMGGGTNLPLQSLAPLYCGLEVQITAGILREKSLSLFKDFFSNSDNEYLKNSLLATYTLDQ